MSYLLTNHEYDDSICIEATTYSDGGTLKTKPIKVVAWIGSDRDGIKKEEEMPFLAVSGRAFIFLRR
jgi:hypothetical protein